MRISPPFIAGSLIGFALPLVVFALPPANAPDLLNRISTHIINPVIYILFAAAFVVFVWGVVQFIVNSDNEEARSTGAKHMIWGIIGMVVMVGAQGIIGIINNTVEQIGG